MEHDPGPEPPTAVGDDGDDDDDGAVAPPEEIGPGAPGELDEPGSGGKDPLRFNSWMKRSATGAVMTGIAVGLQQALELPRQDPAFVIEASGQPEDPDRTFDLHFDPDSPADTVAVIRRRPEAEPGEPGGPSQPEAPSASP